MKNVKITKDEYGRVIEVTVSFSMKCEVDRYGDGVIAPSDATGMTLGDATEFVKGELFDISPNDLWEKVVNKGTYQFDLYETEDGIDKYYDVHCSFMGEGYSLPVYIRSNVHNITSEDVIEHCKRNSLFEDFGDEKFVDSVTEITLEEYEKLKTA